MLYFRTPARFLFLLPLFLCFWCTQLRAQQPDDALSIYGFNEKFLEHLIKEKIDSVRLAHGLKPLYNDSILYVAAKHHAAYLFQKKELSHTEPENLRTETPQKRAEFFGAVNYLVGENVAFTYVNIPTKDKKGKAHTNATYNQTATDFALMWVHSPGHYKNIITPDYNATGVAIWSEPKTGRIYGVQKFANILYKYTFDENKAFFSYSNYVPPVVTQGFDSVAQHLHKGRHAYRLKNPGSAARCERCYGDNGFRFGLSRIETRKNKIYFSSYDAEAVLSLLKHRRDGFAVELIPYSPYDCGNPAYYSDPSRRNQQCVFSGKVLQPVYKKKALRGFRSGNKIKKIKKKIEKNKIKKYEISLGKLPKTAGGYYELNLAVIQQKRVCRILRFSGFCGDTLDRFYSLPLYVDSVLPGMDVGVEYKNISFSIPFQKGKTEYSMKDIKPITDSLLSENFSADSVIIQAYSSVEGKEDLNKKLQEERAGHLVKALAANQKEKLNTRIVSGENWELFNKQVSEKAALKEFRGLTHEKVKELLSDTLKQRQTEVFLKEQRVAHIRLRAREIITEKNIGRYLTAAVKTKKSRISKLLAGEKRSLKSQVDSLELLMRVGFKYVQNKTLQPDFFKLFYMDTLKPFTDYNLNYIKYTALLDSTMIRDAQWRHTFYSGVVNLYNHDRQSFFVNYNMLMLIQQYGKEMNVVIKDNEQDSYLADLQMLSSDSLQRSLCEKLKLNFSFMVCRQTKEEIPEDKRALHALCLNTIHSYFAAKSLSLAEKNKVSAYYIYHSRDDWALELLWPDYEQKINNPAGLVLLAKILYQNYQEKKDPAYYIFLEEIYARLGKAAFCPMFIGPCNISFQAFDYEPFRNFYCDKCGDYLNYAKAPQAEK